MEKTNSRTKNSVRNIAFAVTSYAIQVLLTFIIRVVFLRVFAVDYLGINTLFANILTILAVVESGFGAAMVFALYKPMAENNEEEVRQLISLYKKWYKIIAFIILGIGILITPLLPFLIKDFNNIDLNLYLIYFFFLINSFVTYFTAHRRSLFYADQRNDLESKINSIAQCTYACLQLIAILVLKNFYVYCATAGLNNLFINLLITIVTNKKYKKLLEKPEKKLDEEKYKDIKKNVKALFLHRIGGIVLSGTDGLIMSAFVGLVLVGKYSNYLMIVTCLNSVINMCLTAIKGSVGNSIATNDSEQNLKLFNKLNCAYLFIISFCSVCLINLSNPFVSTIFGKDLLLDYFTVIIISINFYLFNVRQLLVVFKDCKGLFWENRLSPVVESLINIIASLIFVRFFGVAGVLMGTILSNICMPLWNEPYTLNKHYFKRSNFKYLLRLGIYTVLTTISSFITYFACMWIPDVSILSLIVKFLLCGVVALTSTLALFMVLPDFRGLIKTFIIFVKNKLKNKQTSN